MIVALCECEAGGRKMARVSTSAEGLVVGVGEVCCLAFLACWDCSIKRRGSKGIGGENAAVGGGCMDGMDEMDGGGQLDVGRRGRG